MANNDLIIKRKVKYSGVFDFRDFYDALNDVFDSLAYDIDEVDHKLKQGKAYTFRWECTKNVDDYSRFKIIIAFQATSLKKVKVDDNGKEKEMYEADVRIIVRSFIVTDYAGRWEGNPYTQFLQRFFDKYLYGKQGSPAVAKGAYKEWVGKIDEDTNHIINEAKSFLHMYKR